SYVLQTLYSTISTLCLPTSWGDVDTSHISYRIGTNSDAQHLNYERGGSNPSMGIDIEANASLNEHDEVQLIVYRKRHTEVTQPYIESLYSSPKTPRVQFDKMVDDVPILRSITVKSHTKIYKQKVAITDTTTFADVISFALKSPPPGKQFVIFAADGSVEYMPTNVVRDVIVDVEHAEVLVSLENARDVDFGEFYIKEHTYTEGQMPTTTNTINYGNAGGYVLYQGTVSYPSYLTLASFSALDVEDVICRTKPSYIFMQTSLSTNNSDITNEPTNPEYFQHFNN
ncbi:7326_t:CDS:2, partial [Paraglomus occultum]